MTTVQTNLTAANLWAVLTKEITGIQVLWETVERALLKPDGKGLALLKEDSPLVFRLLQTALMESMLMRLSRLMDPENSGKKEGDRPNLSLKRLVALEPGVGDDEMAIRRLWDGSNLKTLRDKYLSHNDLTRSLIAQHSLNIPLETADIEAMRALASGLRSLRQSVHRKFASGVAYLDESLDNEIQRDVDILSRSLHGSQLFFELLPDHEVLQQAWQAAGHG
ncbi:hypothetical protein AZOA_12050 [Azoarcus sp. Aa7]|nr:hypothetical protein [Azoarcus sp. Aa7]